MDSPSGILAEDQFHLLFETMGEGVVYQDATGRIIAANPAAERILGLTQDEMMGRTSMDPRWGCIREDGSAIPGSDHPAMIALRTGRPVLNVLMGIFHPRENGYRWAVVSAIPQVRPGEAAPFQVYTTSTDVTEIRSADAARRESETKFSLLIDAANEGIILHRLVFDANGKPIEYVLNEMNPASERILGKSKAEVIGRSSREVYGTAEPPYLDTYAEVAKTGIPQRFETYFAPMDRHFYVSTVPLGTDGFATIFFDMSDSKRLEEALRNRLLVLTQPPGDTGAIAFGDIFDLDEIQALQDAFARAAGVSSIISDTAGNPITRPSGITRFCSQIIQKTERGLANCIRSDAELGRVSDHLPNVRPCLCCGLMDAGMPIMLGDRAIANWLVGQALVEPCRENDIVEYAAGLGADPEEAREALAEVPRISVERFSAITELLQIIAIQLSRLALQNLLQGREISRRMDAERDLRELNLELEKRVAARTGDLEEINRDLSAFSYSVSHDLRTPLRAIDGFSQALLEDCAAGLDVSGKDYLNRIRAATLRMSSLIDDMLHLSRITRKELSLTEIDLSAMATEALGELKNMNPGRIVSCEIQPGMTAFADPQLMRIALTNLLSNSWKYSAKHKTAKIGFRWEEKNGETVFIVSDDGAGFDMTYVDRLFGVFQRLHSAKDFEGNGIGLATVKRIVNKHGGRIWAEGAAEKGASFYFTLPGSKPDGGTPDPLTP
jgi:signal transduction histidine kinase/PAS domain-containing protein